MPTLETRDKFLKHYTLGLSASLLSLKEHGLLARAPPLEFLVASFRAVGWVLIRTCKESKLQPEWEGPFQVLLDVVYLDFSNVFVTVSHDILVMKLRKCGMDEWIMVWAENWFTG